MSIEDNLKTVKSWQQSSRQKEPFTMIKKPSTLTIILTVAQLMFLPTFSAYLSTIGYGIFFSALIALAVTYLGSFLVGVLIQLLCR